MMGFDRAPPWHLFRLCYCAEGWAWFTTQKVLDQWGHKWTTAPYEHNAGPPQPWAERQELPRYWLARLHYERDGWYTPGEIGNPAGGPNSPHTVEIINSCRVPWLTTCAPWEPSPKSKCEIFAGCPMPDFIDAVILHGGTIFMPFKPGETGGWPCTAF